MISKITALANKLPAMKDQCRLQHFMTTTLVFICLHVCTFVVAHYAARRVKLHGEKKKAIENETLERGESSQKLQKHETFEYHTLVRLQSFETHVRWLSVVLFVVSSCLIFLAGRE